MKYIIDMLETKLREEQKISVLPGGFESFTKAGQVAFEISQRIALRRIPQLQKALKILNEANNELREQRE